MSKIPAPAKLPKPKSVSKSNANSDAHDKLFRLAWAKSEGIFAAVFATSADELLDTSIKEKRLSECPRSNLKQAITETENAQENHKADQHLLTVLAQRKKFLLESRAAYFPALPESIATVSDVEVTLQEPLYKEKYGSLKKEVDGYVDMKISGRFLASLDLTFEPLHGFNTCRGLDAVIRKDRNPSPEQIEDAKNVKVSWKWRHERECMWLDVRPTLGPIGQLLKELKTLRAYFHSEAAITVVTSSADAQTRAILLNEGFGLVTEAELNLL